MLLSTSHVDRRLDESIDLELVFDPFQMLQSASVYVPPGRCKGFLESGPEALAAYIEECLMSEAPDEEIGDGFGCVERIEGDSRQMEAAMGIMPG